MQVFRFQESKSRGTAEFPIAYYYIDETHPRYQMPCHWHTECEIVHIRQGNFTARIDDTEYVMEPGDTLWIRGGALHSGVSRDCVYECIVFDLDLLRTDLGACQPLLEGLRQNLSEVAPLLPHTCTGIVRAAEDLIRSVREQPVGYAFLVLGGLYRLLGEIQQAGCIRAARPQFPAAYRSTAFPVTIVRPSHTYGRTKVPVAVEGKNGGWPVVSRIMRGKPVIIHGDGLSLWTFTHNTDFARAFLGLMGNPHAIGEAVQIISDETLTWNQAYEIIGRHIGKAPEIVHMSVDFLAASNPEYRASLIGDKANSVVFDNSKIKRLVPGFHATVRFDQGVGDSIRYILAHPEYQKEDPEFDAWCDRMIDIYRRAMQEASQIKL